MNIKAEEGDSDDSILKKPVEWTKTSNGGCCNEDSDSDGDSDDELVYATGFPPPPPGKRLAPVGQEVDAEEVRDGKEAPQLTGQTTSGATASGTVTTSCRCSNSTAEDAGDVNPATSGGSSTAATLSAVTSPTALWPPHGIGGEGGGGGGDEGLSKRIEEMEEEQEELTNSLMEMTSHFAKVQLRLQQVVNAPSERREDLLKELEHFAFRGIPNLNSPRPMGDGGGDKDASEAKRGDEDTRGQQRKWSTSSSEHETKHINDEILAVQRKKHADLIQQLKTQLEDLESYAYESGEAIVPSNLLQERQKLVMEQLRDRLNLNVTEKIVELSEEEVIAEVDTAVGQLLNPLKMKCHLVNQLKTQITDLEMFIEFLQSEATEANGGGLDAADCGCAKHSDAARKGAAAKRAAAARSFSSRRMKQQEELNKQTENILQKTVAVLQLAAVSQFGCGARVVGDGFAKNTLKRTPKGNHYGDLRARLELAVDHMLDACSQVECVSTTTGASTDDEPEFLMKSPRVTTIARKQLATAVRDLMQHGLIQGSSSPASFVPFFSCMSRNSAAAASAANPTTKQGLSAAQAPTVHAWRVVLRYYELKRGHEFNSAPQRKLSQSFGLDLSSAGGSTSAAVTASATTSNKQSLLATVGQIIATHEPYRRSDDAKFKAFVCAGLNKRKLIPWLKLILRNQTLLESSYHSWSYTVSTGFDDAFRALERLSIYVFDIPVNVAVRQFQDMSEAF